MFGQAVKARLALTTLHCLKSVVQSNTKQWQLCVRPCFRELLYFVVLFATWLLKLESTDGVCTSIFVLNNVACGLLWICESLMLQKIAHCLASHQTQKNEIQTKTDQSLLFGIFTSCAPALLTICSIQIALLVCMCFCLVQLCRCHLVQSCVIV